MTKFNIHEKNYAQTEKENFQHNKGHLQKLPINIILNHEMLNYFPSKIRSKETLFVIATTEAIFLSSIVLEQLLVQ